MTLPTWLVTGAAGFIGSNFVRKALEERPGIRIVGFDKLTYAGSLENLRALPDPERFEFKRGDIAEPEAVRDVFRSQRPTAILNFAAETHVDRAIEGPRAFIETNVRGTFELLEAARALHAEASPGEAEAFRFLHVSTDEVYGSLGAEGYFDESTPYAPNSPYSASKAGADHLVRAYHQTYGLPTLITNCSNNFGPYQLPEKLIPLMLLNAIEGKPLPIYGDGGNVRDWIFVEDHCAGVLRALEAGRPGEQYAFGGDSERTNLQVVDSLCAALERVLPAAGNAALAGQGIRRYDELKSFVEDRPGHDRRYAIDASKAARELDWRPEHDFESALARTVEWYLGAEDWRRAIQEQADHRRRRGLLDEADDAASADGESS